MTKHVRPKNQPQIMSAHAWTGRTHATGCVDYVVYRVSLPNSGEEEKGVQNREHLFVDILCGRFLLPVQTEMVTAPTTFQPRPTKDARDHVISIPSSLTKSWNETTSLQAVVTVCIALT